jgi:hypothetical protein
MRYFISLSGETRGIIAVFLYGSKWLEYFAEVSVNPIHDGAFQNLSVRIYITHCHDPEAPNARVVGTVESPSP